MKKIDLTGQRFGRLVVIQEVQPKAGLKRPRTTWKCVCDCGNFCCIESGNLKSGTSTSCGCYYREVMNNFNKSKSKGVGEAAFWALYISYKKGAKNRGLSFEITVDEFRTLTKQNCFYCGCEPAGISKQKSYNGIYVYNGVDRIDSSNGYTSDNVVSCCKRCNQAKNDMSVNDFINWIAKIYNSFVVKKERINKENET